MTTCWSAGAPRWSCRSTRLIEDFDRALGRVHAGWQTAAAADPTSGDGTTRRRDMNDQKNTILAIVLSAIVLIGWQYFVGLPQMEKQKQEAQLKQQQQQQQVQTSRSPASRASAAHGGAPPQLPGPGAAATPPEQLSREAALAASPRVAIDTPRLTGSIALKGGRIDDLSLTQYRETVDPTSPPIVLLSPSGSPHPFYAEFGWVGGAGAAVKAAGRRHASGRSRAAARSASASRSR